MKLPLFLISSTIGAALVLYKKHTDTLHHSKAQIHDMQKNIQKFKNSAATIREQKETINIITKELAYNFKVFNQETQAHLAEIKKITQKYQEPN